MRTMDEIKAAAARLNPDEQVELFRWCVESDAFKQRQLTALKRDLVDRLEQLAHGRYRTYDDANLMQLAEEVGRSGREQLKSGKGKRKPTARTTSPASSSSTYCA
jgi:hypothetical protein